jgi:hypothetical protein
MSKPQSFCLRKPSRHIAKSLPGSRPTCCRAGSRARPQVSRPLASLHLAGAIRQRRSCCQPLLQIPLRRRNILKNPVRKRRHFFLRVRLEIGQYQNEAPGSRRNPAPPYLGRDRIGLRQTRCTSRESLPRRRIRESSSPVAWEAAHCLPAVLAEPSRTQRPGETHQLPKACNYSHFPVS